MTKLFFSAITMVAFAGSAFASNEMVNAKESVNAKKEFSKVCVMNIKDKNGNIINTVYVVGVPDSMACGSQAVKDRAIAIHNESLSLQPN